MTAETLKDRVRSGSNGAAGSVRKAEPYVTYKKRMNWALFWAWNKLLGWLVITKIGLAVIYVSMIREALATLIPALAQKLSRAVPGLGFLANFDETRQLDLAFFMAIFCFWQSSVFGTKCFRCGSLVTGTNKNQWRRIVNVARFSMPYWRS